MIAVRSMLSESSTATPRCIRHSAVNFSITLWPVSPPYTSPFDGPKVIYIDRHHQGGYAPPCIHLFFPAGMPHRYTQEARGDSTPPSSFSCRQHPNPTPVRTQPTDEPVFASNSSTRSLPLIHDIDVASCFVYSNPLWPTETVPTQPIQPAQFSTTSIPQPKSPPKYVPTRSQRRSTTSTSKHNKQAQRATTRISLGGRLQGSCRSKYRADLTGKPQILVYDKKQDQQTINPNSNPKHEQLEGSRSIDICRQDTMSIGK